MIATMKAPIRNVIEEAIASPGSPLSDSSIAYSKPFIMEAVRSFLKNPITASMTMVTHIGDSIKN